MGKPSIIAHRGGAGLWPENTLGACRRALALGVDGLEVDVHLTADSKLVVHHDYQPNPALTCLDGSWLATPGPLIRDIAYADLQRYDVGRVDPSSDYAMRRPDQVALDGERIVTLSDVIELVQTEGRADTQLLIEIKSEALRPELSASPSDLALAAVALLHEMDFISQSVIIAFNWYVLVEIQRLEPNLRTGYLTDPGYMFGEASPPEGVPAPTQDIVDQMRAYRTSDAPWTGGFDPYKYQNSIPRAIAAAGGSFWGPYYRDATADAVQQAHQAGLGVSVWTANTQDDFIQMIDNSVDVITTDYPDRLLAFLESE